MGTPTALVVEDSPEIAMTVRALLQREGYDVTVAHDGTRGLAAASATNPELVILDLSLPDDTVGGTPHLVTHLTECQTWAVPGCAASSGPVHARTRQNRTSGAKRVLIAEG